MLRRPAIAVGFLGLLLGGCATMTPRATLDLSGFVPVSADPAASSAHCPQQTDWEPVRWISGHFEVSSSGAVFGNPVEIESAIVEDPCGPERETVRFLLRIQDGSLTTEPFVWARLRLPQVREHVNWSHYESLLKKASFELREIGGRSPSQWNAYHLDPLPHVVLGEMSLWLGSLRLSRNVTVATDSPRILSVK